ncbi:hypothetical protein AKO1_014364 [Acrasis kona]|uniref:Uncharacterized protein n=1 Tax=Acrasis kona TaxID=1008807 RepID=A0AAW2Z150_9EUKA
MSEVYQKVPTAQHTNQSYQNYQPNTTNPGNIQVRSAGIGTVILIVSITVGFCTLLPLGGVAYQIYYTAVQKDWTGFGINLANLITSVAFFLVLVVGCVSTTNLHNPTQRNITLTKMYIAGLFFFIVVESILYIVACVKQEEFIRSQYPEADKQQVIITIITTAALSVAGVLVCLCPLLICAIVRLNRLNDDVTYSRL